MKQRIRIDKSVPNTGAMDFSHLLDAPAGKHGFTRVRDGHLWFEDGARARFVGFNFPARANMPDHETAERVSARLATMGVNVVRLHAADVGLGPSGWTSNPDSPLIDYAGGTSRALHPVGLDRFDYWTAKLRERGIYLHVDLLVARSFLEGDDLDYPGGLRSTKSSSHLNERLIELQKEYATALLTHINPYSGLALIDDPAVMAIQVTNEDSIFYDVGHARQSPGVAAYRDEMRRRFNHFLLAKYDSRENLARAWTFEGQCALGDGEDPSTGTVRCIKIGDYHQPMNEPMGDWAAEDGPARYADFTEFGIAVNRKYYGQMLRHIRGLGAKVPLVTSCLLTGAADVYSHADGDMMENNAYFNHPAPRRERDALYVPFLREYVSTDPRKATYPTHDPRSHLLTQVAASMVGGKPFILSEWNEYGEAPFHSSSFLMTAAYGCLQDWDGLIIYCYHTADRHDDQPADEIANIMDAYNDPSLILQFGVMSSLFLGGAVRPAENSVDVAYTRDDLLTQPGAHRMPYSILPFISRVRSVFLEHGEVYGGDADVAVSAGFVGGGNYDGAKHAVVYAHSPYRDALRHDPAGDAHLARYRREAPHAVAEGVHLGGQFLVFDDIAALAASGDYTFFADAVDAAMKHWGLLGPDRGVDGGGAIVSDTGELVFNPAEGCFQIRSERCAFFSGDPIPRGDIRLARRYVARSANRRITLALLPLDGEEVSRSSRLLLTALGESGMDETVFTPQEDGVTRVELKGKLYLDTLEGSLCIADCPRARLWALDSCGNRVARLEGLAGRDGSLRFDFDGSLPCGSFELIVG